MGEAVWSADPVKFNEFPAYYFAQFFKNHGFLNIKDQPQWLTIKGRSRQYIKPVTQPYVDQIRLNCPVASVRRYPDYVEIQPQNEVAEKFDQVVIATHSDQALALLDDLTDTEKNILGVIPYQENQAVLHCDESLLPSKKAAWASWNYHIPQEDLGRVAVYRYGHSLRMEKGPARFMAPLYKLYHSARKNTKVGSRNNILAHYDLGNDFYALFLDQTMTYSCGIFEREDSTLKEASEAKYDRICRKLHLTAGDRVVEIGTGWGGFAVHAAQNYGVHVTTTTISDEQHQFAQIRIKAVGLEDRITLLKKDYRDLSGKFGMRKMRLPITWRSSGKYLIRSIPEDVSWYTKSDKGAVVGLSSLAINQQLILNGRQLG